MSFNKLVEEPSIFYSFTFQESFLLRGNKLCISKCPLSDLIAKGAHGGALVGYFCINKTVEILKEHFYWPKMGGDVPKVITRYATCHMAKSHFYQALYTPILVPSRP